MHHHPTVRGSRTGTEFCVRLDWGCHSGPKRGKCYPFFSSSILDPFAAFDFAL